MAFIKVDNYVFINQDSGYLMIDILNAYADAGYSCVLVTGRLVVRNRPLNPQIKVENIVKYNRKSNLTRFWSWILGTLQIFLLIKAKYRNSKIFIVSNPPLAVLLPLVLNNRYDLLIFDIFPDALAELGYIKAGSSVNRLWERLNKKVFPSADRVFTITSGMGEVLRKYSGHKPVTIVHLWTDNNFLKPVSPLENPFVIRYHLQDKFIVLYSGNIGLASELDVLLDVADRINNRDVLFLIIGEGAKKVLMARRVTDMRLSNVLMLPFQPASELPYSLSSAQLAVVALGKGETKLAVPSKLYNYLSVGAPLLCLSSHESEVQRLVDKYQCGRNFEWSNQEGIIDYINYLAENHEIHNYLKDNSLIASKDFSGENVRQFLPLAE